MDNIYVFIVVGFVAQMIDGTLGMAYGVSASSFMLAVGVPPVIASASVHAAEMVTTGVSGLAHHAFGNVRGHLTRRLIVSGAAGAAVGAYVLTQVPANVIKPVVACYLMIMGIFIVIKARKRQPEETDVRTHIIPLGLGGGFLDAVGGGGWGPIVTSTLLARGNPARFTIGSVSAAEFFVAAAASVTFIATIGITFWKAILGLAIGGALAAPLAAYLARRVPTKRIMLAVGITVILLSLRTLYLALQ